MTKPLVLEPEAGQELEEASVWYEGRRAGLGREFLASLESTFDRIRTFPESGSAVPFVPKDLEVRRVPLRRFPYQVVYLETEHAIHVLAIAHDRRRPGYWLQRFGE